MDEFKIVVIIAVLVSLAALGTMILIAEDVVDNGEIPDVTRGQVISKAPISDQHSENYIISLLGNQDLYILNNPTLYAIIQENQNYVFDCRIDFNNKITIINNATLIPIPTTAP